MVAVPDWQLVERIEREFRPYIPAGGSLRFIGPDERSQYQENGLEAFKRLVEEQDEPPHTIQVMGFGNNGKAQHAPSFPSARPVPPLGSARHRRGGHPPGGGPVPGRERGRWGVRTGGLGRHPH
jgi:hypothetical protein